MARARAARGPQRRPAVLPLVDGLRSELLAYLNDGGTGGQLAAAAGLAPSVVNRFALGSRGLSLESGARIAAALGLRLVLSRRPAASRRKSSISSGRRVDLVEVSEVETDTAKRGVADGGAE